MGMSASQARFLSLTARMNDTEFKSQQLVNTKLRLSDEASAIADEYTNGLNKTQLMYTTYQSGSAQNVALTPSNLATYGFALRSRTNPFFDVESISKLSSSELYEKIESGELYLVKEDLEVSISSESNLFLQNDEFEVKKAEADYNAKMNRINKRDKELDNEIKKLDTEHNALKTEAESVKSIVKNNVEKSFNIFG